MEVIAETADFADVRVQMQVLRLSGSVHVWASTDGSAPTLALSTPGRLAATSALIGGAGDAAAASSALAARLATKTGLAVYACLQLPRDAEMLRDAVAKRLLEIIQRPPRAEAETAVEGGADADGAEEDEGGPATT
jgi:Proteasome assembly chaperone 4